jgi:hypothetical protein
MRCLKHDKLIIDGVCPRCEAEKTKAHTLDKPLYDEEMGRWRCEEHDVVIRKGYECAKCEDDRRKSQAEDSSNLDASDLDKMSRIGKKPSAFDTQVGGSHYKQYVIQPYEFFFVNEITHEKAAIIRRILRYDHPTGKGMEDIDKIMHECQLIKELYGKNIAAPIQEC